MSRSTAGRLVRLPRTVRSLRRLRDILRVVSRHGFEGIVAQTGLESWLTFLHNALLPWRRRSVEVDRAPEERVRLALEDLGSTFIKFGQILATRPDLIPMSLVRELRKLQDEVPPFPAAQARQVLNQEWGRSPEEVLAEFHEQPLAAGSIAQVHLARLRDGTEVVIKVQRPDLDRVIRSDLDLLLALATLLEANVSEVRPFRPVALVKEFARSIERETDFTREAFHVRRFAACFTGDDRFATPRVFEDLSTRRVLVQERVLGIKISEVDRLRESGEDLPKLARHAVEFTLRQIFVHGFFHGDPHPGNFFVLPEGRLCLVDYGMMGRLGEERRHDILSFLVAVTTLDMEGLMKIFDRLGLMPRGVDLRALREDGADLVERYGSMPLGQIDLGRFFADLFDVLTRHQVVVPPDLLLVGKAMATVEGIARALDPEMEPLAVMKPLLFRVYLRRMTDPRTHLRGVERTLRAYLRLIEELPGQVRALVDESRESGFPMRLSVADRDEFVRLLSRSNNRIGLTILTAALLLTGAVLSSSGGDMVLPGVTALGVAAATTGALWLAVWRSGGL